MADIDKDEEYYLRATLLLLKGCRYIALETLLRAVRDKKDSGKDLDDVLKDAKEKLNSVFDCNQRKKLFSDGDAKEQTDTWDISLIIGVILTCFKSSLTSAQLQAVKTIKYKRNTVLGHSSVASLPYEDYDDVSRELENAVNILSSTFDESVQQKCKQLVNQSLTGNLQTVKEDVKTEKDYDNFCKVLLKKIEELERQNRDLRTEIKRLLEEKGDRVFRTVQVVDTEIVIGTSGNDTDTRDMTQLRLTAVTDEVKRREGSDVARNEIWSAVDYILKEIQQHGMNVDPVEKMFILRVKCKSYNQVLRLMEFTDDTKFQRLLRTLAEALTRSLGLSHALELSFRISTKSVGGLLTCLRDENAQVQKKLSLPVRYHSVAGLAHLWSFIEEGKGASILERLSKAVSKHLQKDISIELSLNPEQVIKSLQNPDTERLTLAMDEKVTEGLLKTTYWTVKQNIELKFKSSKNMFSFLFVSTLAFFVESSSYPKSVTLRQMKIGKQNIDSLELTYKEIQEIVKFKENKRELVKVCVRNFGRSLRTKEVVKFDKEDFEIECEKEDSFADSVILNLIANELTKAHEEVAATIPSVFVGDKEPTLICIVKQKIQLQEFRGFPVKTAPMDFLSKSSIIAENSIDRNSEQYRSVVKDNIVDINEVISHHSERLLSEHSNIEAIRASFVKQGQLTTTPNSPCVVIYCRVKGAVPYKENIFPKTLPHPKKEISYPTDIRIGHFSFCYGATDWHQELAMGCSIGERNTNVGGTLGPFVNVVETNELCFLTARHVFPPYSSRTDDQILKATAVQPSDYHLSQHPYKGPDRECGEVVACALNEEIDAALVKINENRKPSRGLFVDVARGDFLLAGLSAKQISAFDDGEVMDVSGLTVQDNACRPILKIGVTSGLTKGYLSTTEGVVKETEEFQTGEASYGTQREFHRMRGQITVDSMAKKVFCQSGDSGAGVFILNSDMRLQCIGMIVGVMSDYTAIVTPIQKILDTLKDKYGKGELQLKTFSLENMETND